MTRHSPISGSATLRLLACALIVTGCETTSPPSPPPPLPRIPSPPVAIEPQDLQTYLPKAQELSSTAQSWLDKLRLLRTSEPQN